MSEHPYKFATREAIEEEARRWLIRLDGDTPLSDSESAALREWTARSPAHRRELKRIARFWNDANVLTELAIPLSSTRKGRIARWGPAGFATALALLLVVSFVSWYGYAPEMDGNGVYGTVVGEQRTLALHDGSVVQLNTDSQVQVDYGESLRRIRLLRGEAHFDVAKELDRSFEVYAGDGVVRAVGTSFSVQLKNNDVNVAVTEGRVALATVESATAPNARALPATVVIARTLGTLESGQTAVFSKQIKQIEAVPVPELVRRESWREGLLIFNGEPLSEVVAEVNRYVPLTIEIADPTLNDLQVGGRFKVGEFNTMFEVLESSFGIEVVHLSDDRIQLHSRRRP